MSGLDLLNTRKNTAAFTPGYAPTDAGDVAAAQFSNVRQNYTTDAEIRLIGDPLHKRNATIQERLGKGVSEITGTNRKYLNPSIEGRVQQAAEDNDLIDSFINTGRKENPGLWDGIKTTAEIRAEGKEVANKAAQNFADTAARNPSATSRIVGSLGGGVAGAMTDPVNILTLPLGAGEVKIAGTGSLAVARGIALTAVKEGGIQAAIEAASIPQIARWQNEVGHKYGLSEAATDVAFGFLGGAGIRLGAEGIMPALRAVRRGGEKASSYMLDQVATRAPGLNQTVRDSLKFMSRAAYVDEDAPIPMRSQKELKEHRAAVEKVSKDVESYSRPAPEIAGVKKVVTPRNEIELEVKDRIVELEDLVTSDQGAYNQALQPRDRANRVASDARINEIAARLDPAQLGESRVSNTGSPIVGPDMMVESGNGRVMALKKVYGAHPDSAQRYRDFLESQGHDTEGFKNPVLIRQRISELTDDQRKKFVVYSNEDVADRLSMTERAMADAKLMNDGTLEQYKGGDIETDLNAGFVRDFAGTAVSPAERNAFITPGGKLSQEGAKRVRGALLAKAYSDPGLIQKLLEDTDNNIKTIGNVLMDMAGDWARLRAAVARGEIPPAMDITRDLMDAVNVIINARNSGRPVTDFIDQAGLFAESNLTAETTAILRGLYNAKLTRAQGADKVKEFLSFYTREAAKVQAGPDLLGEKPLAPMDILKKSLDRIHGKEETAAFKFDEDASPERKAIREAGLEKEADGIKSPAGMSIWKALDEMAARPETIKQPGYKGKKRIELRQKILKDLTKGEYGNQKVMEIVLGPTGAGKSSVLVKRLQKDIGAIVVDSDIVKERLPEYDGGLGANAVHEESKVITQDWLAEAIANDWNIIHPIVGANAEKVGHLVDEMLSLGYSVNIRLVHIPAEESLRRMIARFGEEGRLVPPSYVMSIGDGPVKTFDTLKQREGINAYSYFDNNVKIGKEPRIVESNDPRYVADQEAGPGIQRAGEKGGPGEGQEAAEITPGAVDDFMDRNAYRLREYRETPVRPDADADIEVKPTDRLEARRAQFDDLLKENPDMLVTLDDGSSVRIADFSERLKMDERVIEAITTCRLS